MLFGLPTPSWHTCGPSPGAISTTMGPIVILDLILGAKSVVLWQNTTNWVQKNKKERPKIPPEAPDGSHGGLGRGQEAENGLEAGEYFWNFDPLLQET